MKKMTKTLQMMIMILCVSCVAGVGLFVSGCDKIVAITAITLTADASEVTPGGHAEITAAVTPTNASKSNLIYEITEGAALVSFTKGESGGVLIVKNTATSGSQIKLKAKSKSGGVTSNELTFSVVAAIQLQSIVLNATKTNVLPGDVVTLSVTPTPSNAPVSAIYEITQGGDYAELDGNQLTINDSADEGSVIKVKAISGTIESQVVTITVTDEDAGLSILTDNTKTVDSKAGIQTAIIATVLDGLTPVVGKQIQWSVIDGDENISIDNTGYSCYITVTGHGSATIEARLTNGRTAETVVTAIMPPDDLDVKEVFTDRIGQLNGRDYAVGKGEDNKLPFAVDIIGSSKVCKDVEYTFAIYNSSTKAFEADSTAAEYAEGKIEFKKAGRIRVTATSVSGSAFRPTASHVFDVNEGINVSTFAELKSALEANFNTHKVVNFVVLEKTNAYSKQYGYELVPVNDSTALWAFVQTAGGVTIHGNNHAINVADVPRGAANGFFSNHYAVIEIASKVADEDYSVNLFDFMMVGGVESVYTYNPGSEVNDNYTYRRGVRIGATGSLEAPGDIYRAPATVTMDNVDISRMNTGLVVQAAKKGSKISNMRISDCWENGVEISGSIITLENMTYGLCGATALELVPENSSFAWDDLAEAFVTSQKVTFAGTIEFPDGAANNGTTPYLAGFAAEFGAPNFMYILDGILATATAHVDGSTAAAMRSGIVAPMDGAPGEYFKIVALLFNDTDTLTANTSTFEYENAANSYINFSELTGVDYVHKYILLDLEIGPMNLGKALLVNWNYLG